MHHKATCGSQRHHFGGSRARVHEPQTRPGWRFGRFQNTINGAGLADFLDVTQSLFLNGGQAADDIALGGLGFREVIGLVGDDEIVIRIPGFQELFADFRRARPRGNNLFAPGDFRSLAE
jgi:hypothetical protein